MINGFNYITKNPVFVLVFDGWVGVTNQFAKGSRYSGSNTDSLWGTCRFRHDNQIAYGKQNNKFNTHSPYPLPQAIDGLQLPALTNFLVSEGMQKLDEM